MFRLQLDWLPMAKPRLELHAVLPLQRGWPGDKRTPLPALRRQAAV